MIDLANFSYSPENNGRMQNRPAKRTGNTIPPSKGGAYLKVSWIPQKNQGPRTCDTFSAGLISTGNGRVILAKRTRVSALIMLPFCGLQLCAGLSNATKPTGRIRTWCRYGRIKKPLPGCRKRLRKCWPRSGIFPSRLYTTKPAEMPSLSPFNMKPVKSKKKLGMCSQ